MTPTAETEPLTTELIRRIAGLSRGSKEQLFVLLQENLDGGPFVGDLPDQEADRPAEVESGWRTELARRIADMRAGRVERIDAQGSAARLLHKMIRKHSP